MKVVLLMTVHEYPAYRYNLGQVCHGNRACVRCMDETHSLYLKASHKTVYMGHRRWQNKNDEWRNREDLFNTEKKREGSHARGVE